jgi:hypothetical protein
MDVKKNERIFIASSEIFSNFQTSISLYDISTIDELINIFRSRLLKLFEDNNLSFLAEKVKKSNFHIHSYTIEQILTSNYEDFFYICDHC